MKLAHYVSTGLLLLLLASAAPLLAQDERHDNGDKPAAQEEKHDQNPDVKKDQDRDLKHDQSPDAKQEEKKDRAQDEKAQDKAQDRRADEHAQDRDQARDRAQADARQDRREDRRIPDDKFRASFGREHTFRIERPVIVEGAPRFQYAGYWFVFVQPWPVGWSYADPVFIDYIDGGYWVLSPVHPGVQISINLVL